jgi:hypothetical protein
MTHPTNPFPATLPHSGDRIIDETCRCEHRRTAHANTVAFGHGHCSATGCSCTKFSWSAHVIAKADR